MEKWTIEIDRMRVRANHGVMPQERLVGNDFEVSLKVEADTDSITRAAETGDLASSVSYADLAGLISEVMAEPEDLLETVARKISRRVSERFPLIKGGSVKVTKLTPPIPAAMAGASVTFQWENPR